MISENTAPAGGPDFEAPRGITVAPIVITAVLVPGPLFPGGGHGGGGGGGGGSDDDRCRPGGSSSGGKALGSKSRRCGISFRLSDPATMGFAFERRLSGRVVKGECRRGSGNKGKRGRRCSFYRRVGAFKRKGAAGENFAPIPRKLGRRFDPGAYRATLRGGDGQGNLTVPVSLAFRVVD